MSRELGWLKLHRQLRSSALYRSLSAEQRSVFVSLLLAANWQPSRMEHGGAWYQVGRGELALTEETLAADAAVSRKVVRTTLRKLMADDSAAGGRGPFLQARWTGPRVGQGLRILTILRYGEFQDCAGPTGPAGGPARAQRGPGVGPAGARSEEVEEVKEVQEDLPPGLRPCADAWARALSSELLAEQHLQKALAGVQALGVAGGELWLRAPDRQKRDIVEEYYGADLLRAVRAELGEDTKLHWELPSPRPSL